MGLSLPPELQQFVQEQIKTGKYKSEEDLLTGAVRILKEKERVATSVAPALRLDVGGDTDLPALVIIVMTQAARSVAEDLKEILEEIRSINATKQKLRELIKKVKRDISRNAGKSDPALTANTPRLVCSMRTPIP